MSAGSAQTGVVDAPLPPTPLISDGRAIACPSMVGARSGIGGGIPPALPLALVPSIEVPLPLRLPLVLLLAPAVLVRFIALSFAARCAAATCCCSVHAFAPA